MGNRVRSILIVLGILFIGLVLWGLFSMDKRFYWNNDLHIHSDQPYGLKMFYDLIDKSSEDVQLMRYSLVHDIDEDSKGNYLITGYAAYWLQKDLDSLLAFVERGNKAFIFTYDIPQAIDSLFFTGNLYRYSWYNEYQETLRELDDTLASEKVRKELSDSLFAVYAFRFGYRYSDSVVHLSYTDFADDGSLMLKYMVIDSPEVYQWSFIPVDSIRYKGGYEILGNINDTLPHFIRFDYGAGELYLHTIPMQFTNYQLLSREALDYTNFVLGSFDDNTIYWDIYNTSFHWDGAGGGMKDFSEGPLTFILSQPVLKRAWSLLMILLVLFLVFNLKRQQRIIPIMEKNFNTSLQYVRTIGELYYNKRDHKSISKKEMELFFYHIRKTYHIQTREIDDEFARKLARLSGVDKRVIDEIIAKGNILSNIDRSTDEMYLAFRKALITFYETATK